uniref:Decapping nuclease n=1 Tax=Glossina brevipalpis TaxID=37001 RepID=A0A1A9WPR1_9MUSC
MCRFSSIFSYKSRDVTWFSFFNYSRQFVKCLTTIFIFKKLFFEYKINKIIEMSDKLEILLTVPMILEKNKRSRINIIEQYFTKPNLVSYIKDDYGKCTKGQSMKYLQLSTAVYPLNLCEGYDVHKCKTFMYKKSLDYVLDWVMSPEGRQHVQENIDKTMIFTRRVALTKIMMSPIMPRNEFYNWVLLVSRYNNNLYMCLDKEDEPVPKISVRRYHHMRLGRLLFSEGQRLPPDTTMPTDSNIHYNALHTSSMGKYNFIYSGSVQGIEADEDINDFSDLSSLNACKYVMTKQIYEKLPYDVKLTKYVSWWIYAYLSNCESIYVATKDFKGMVQKPIEHINVRSIPKDFNFNHGFLIGFLHHFLERVEDLMSNIDSLETVYEFDFNTLDNTIHYKIHSGDKSKIFISDDYIKYCR